MVFNVLASNLSEQANMANYDCITHNYLLTIDTSEVKQRVSAECPNAIY